MIDDWYDNWDLLVIEYRSCQSARKRDKIYLELRKIYYPKLIQMKRQFPDQKYHDEFDSLYDWFLLKAIDKWTGVNSKGVRCHFLSYAYNWCVLKVRGELWEKHVSKDKKLQEMFDNIDYDWEIYEQDFYDDGYDGEEH